MITHGWVTRGKGVQKNKSYRTHVCQDRAIGVVGWGNRRGRGIIELKWPHDSTIGEVMCWINSVPDRVFGRAVLLYCPRDPKAQQRWHIFLSAFFQPNVIQIYSQAQRLIELYFVHCTLITSTNAKALYTLGHALDKLLFLLESTKDTKCKFNLYSILNETLWCTAWQLALCEYPCI